MKTALTLALLTSAAMAAAQIDRDLEPFTALAVNAGINATVVESDGYRLEVTGDRAALDALEIENRGGSLGLGFDDGAAGRLSAEQRSSVRATVHTPRLESAVVNGGGVLESEATWRGEGFRAVANGGAELRLAVEVSGKVSVVANGGAGVRLSGSADEFALNVNGGAEVDASGMAAESVKVMANGGSRAEVQANATLSGMANGQSRVTYRGRAPRADVRTNGGSSVARG